MYLILKNLKKNMKYWNKVNNNYFKKQIKKPLLSTLAFFNFLNKFGLLKKDYLIDAGCGNGANLAFVVKKYQLKNNLIGFDNAKDLIKVAITKYKKFKNIEFKIDNINRIKNKNILKKNNSGIISLQVLCNLKDYKQAILNLSKLNPDFISVSSLFWDSDLSFYININKCKNLKSKKIVNYNIYSLPQYKLFLKKLGYKHFKILKFTPNKKIYTANKKKLGTYTVENKNERIQISGPILMNWYFIIASKKKL
jgi:2-polyprenyl-3-methyl-5-hydroxy-6-metoxy-1,4-benzoquinol methylase